MGAFVRDKSFIQAAKRKVTVKKEWHGSYHIVMAHELFEHGWEGYRFIVSQKRHQRMINIHRNTRVPHGRRFLRREVRIIRKRKKTRPTEHVKSLWKCAEEDSFGGNSISSGEDLYPPPRQSDRARFSIVSYSRPGMSPFPIYCTHQNIHLPTQQSSNLEAENIMKTPGDAFVNDKSDDFAPTIDDALRMLKEGRELEKQKRLWEATEKFMQGCHQLQSLAKNQAIATEEDRQIVTLYNDKAQEYQHQSRQTLLEAMTIEVGANGKDEDFYENLTDDEAERRIRIFRSLFSKQVQTKSTENGLVDKQRSIEERLQELNASLPSRFKTDTERMDSINQGLNRLGLSLYTQKKPFERFQDTLPKSEEDQIEDIIAQAKDEVEFEEKNTSSVATATKSTKTEENDDHDDENSYEETDEDLALDDDQLAICRIRRRVVHAATKLAELLSLLDQAHTASKDEENNVETLDDDSDDDIQKPSVEMYLSSGKKMLDRAQKDLRKARDEWDGAFSE